MEAIPVSIGLSDQSFLSTTLMEYVSVWLRLPSVDQRLFLQSSIKRALWIIFGRVFDLFTVQQSFDERKPLSASNYQEVLWLGFT